MNGTTRLPLSLPATTRTHSQGNGLGTTPAGKEDPVELDCSLILLNGSEGAE